MVFCYLRPSPVAFPGCCLLVLSGQAALLPNHPISTMHKVYVFDPPFMDFSFQYGFLLVLLSLQTLSGTSFLKAIS